MQFFDLSRQFNLNDLLIPSLNLTELSQQEWFLTKIRVDHDCIHKSDSVEGQAIIQSNQNVQIELEWMIFDSGYDLQVLFKGIETEVNQQTLLCIKGAKIIDDQKEPISTHALSLWIEGTLLPLLPNIRREIKLRLNLWDYVGFSD